MQGTSLDEVFSNFGAPFDYQATGYHPLYGIRSTPAVPVRDVSGSKTLLELTHDTLWKSVSEELPRLDPNSVELQTTIEKYRNLKTYHKYLTDEIAAIETRIKLLEEVRQKSVSVSLDFKHQLCQDGLLEKEEFEELTKKLKDLEELQEKLTQKCLTEYKKQATELHCKFQQNSMNLAAYVEFIKTATREMVGDDVKLNTCSICFEKEITHCLVPCGHTFCEACISKSIPSNIGTCMSCRTTIQSKIKLFL